MFISSSNIASSSTCKINIKRTLTTKLLSKQHHFSVITIIKIAVRFVSGLVYLVPEVRGDNESESRPRTRISFNIFYLCIWDSHRVSIAPPHRHRLNVFTPPDSWRNENSWWDIISRLRRPRFHPDPALRERECLQYGFYWYVILATWWKHHSFFGNLNEGKNVSEKCTLIHSLIYLCIGLIYLSSSRRYHIFLISDLPTKILYQKERGRSYVERKYTQTSLSFWTCRHQSEIFVWHEVFYIKIYARTVRRWPGDSRHFVTLRYLWRRRCDMWQLPGNVTSWRHPEKIA